MNTGVSAAADLFTRPDENALSVGGAEHENHLRVIREGVDDGLGKDIRYLGRLLGEVLREQEGDVAFELVESIRQTAVSLRRQGEEAAHAVMERLEVLSSKQTVSVVRAFSHFLFLANIAEDRHHNRLRRSIALAGQTLQPGTIAHAVARVCQDYEVTAAHDHLQKFFGFAHVVPVLTAHPTEVSRKSLLDAQRIIARLLADRERDMTVRERTHDLPPSIGPMGF